MVKSLRQLPDPIRLPPIAVDEDSLPIVGWRHEDRAYGFTEQSGPDGQYKAVIFSYATGTAVEAWDCDTADEASAIAAQEFASAAYGVPSIVQILSDDVAPPKDRQN